MATACCDGMLTLLAYGTAKIFAIGFNRGNVKSQQTFVFSHLFLIK